MESVNDDYRIYEVRPGDSLSAIAAHFGYITPTQLARLNRLSLVGCSLPPVFPGQRLVIPTVPKITTGVRRAPGAALRVKSTVPSASSSPSVRKRAPTAELCTSHSTIGSNPCPVDPAEKQFVKVRAQRVLPSGRLVDGVLLVTPDSLFFDASITASVQNEAYLASHGSPKSVGSDDGEGITPHSDQEPDPTIPHCPSLPKELLDMILCLPLTMLTSMSTMKMLSPPKTSSLHVSDSIVAEQIDVRSQEGRLDSEEPNVIPVKSVGSALNHSERCELSREASSATEDDQFVPPRPTCDLSDHPFISEPEFRHICKLERKGALYLKLTQCTDNTSEPIEHYFLISVECLIDLLSFLLRVGVGSTRKTASEEVASEPGSAPPSPTDPSETPVLRSLVEEALESLDCNSLVPSLNGDTSGVLSDDQLADLGSNFPTHWIGSNLKLVYKAEKDGYSLHTVYRKCRNVEGGVLMVIRDTIGTVFGSIMSEKMYCSNRFYGTGETCVFHWSPGFKRYDWTKKNYFFMHGTTTSFQIGGQSGRNAIWIDEALKYGRSEPTDTFDNPVLSGTLQSFKPTVPPSSDHHIAIGFCDPGLKSSSLNTDFQASPAPDLDVVGLESVPFIIDGLEVWELVN